MAGRQAGSAPWGHCPPGQELITENLLRKTHKAPSLEIETPEALPGVKPGGALGLHKH